MAAAVFYLVLVPANNISLNVSERDVMFQKHYNAGRALDVK
jgi:hypothetical protein